MTPLLAALSKARAAVRCSMTAFSTSPASAARRNLRTAVFSEERTAWLRIRAFSFCRLRLICDFSFDLRRCAPVDLFCVSFGRGGSTYGQPFREWQARARAQGV